MAAWPHYSQDSVKWAEAKFLGNAAHSVNSVVRFDFKDIL